MPTTKNSPQKIRASQRPAANTIVFAAFFLSGLVGLVYESIWLRMLTFTFGSTTLAVSTALAAFMAGLALGSIVLGRLADRIKNHIQAYIILEILIGLYGISTLFTLTNLDQIYGALWSSVSDDFYLLIAVRFVLAFLVIGVGAFLMGGTLPVISRIIIKEQDIIGQQFGSIYAVNTFGAVFGVLLAGYYLIPVLGLWNGIAVAAGINFVIAAGFFFFLRRSPDIAVPQPSNSLPPLRGGERSEGATRMGVGDSMGVEHPRIEKYLLLAFALSGFASLACQVLWTKSLALIIGSSVYAFTIMLATFLFGIAAGSMVMVGLFHRIKQRQYLWFGVIQLGLAFSVLLGALLIGQLPMIFLSLTKWLPHSFFGIQLVEFFVASLAMLPSTLLMGAAFPLVCRIYSGNVIADLGTRIGLIYAVNTLGAVTGAIAAGFILIPYVGTQNTFKILGALYLLIGLVFLVYDKEHRKKWRWFAGSAVALAGILLTVLSPTWNPVLMNSNFPYLVKVLIDNPPVVDKILASKTVYHDEDMSGSVMVYQMYDGSINLNLSGHSEGGTYQGDMNVQIEQAILPAVIHKAPKKALLVGLGAGITLGSLLQVPGIEEVDVLEISSGAVKANRFFSPYNHDALNDPRVNVIVDDARHFLARTQKKYDLIINAPSYSWVSGTANIFTQEFYNQARQRLAPDGIFVAWLHLYSITPPDIKRFIGTVHSVFPDTSLWLASSSMELIVLGSEKPPTVDYAHVQQQLKHKKLFHELGRISRPTPESIIALHLMAGKEVGEYAAGAEINTDNHPVMEFSIPRYLFKWDVNENIRSLTGLRHVSTLPVNGMELRQGKSTIYPAIGLKSNLSDWESSTGFINTYDYQTGFFNRQSEPRLMLLKSHYTFDVAPYRRGDVNADQLKSALLPLAGGREIKLGQFAGAPAYWTQHTGDMHVEYFVSWGCRENNTHYLGNLRASSIQNNGHVWALLTKGMTCYDN